MKFLAIVLALVVSAEAIKDKALVVSSDKIKDKTKEGGWGFSLPKAPTLPTYYKWETRCVNPLGVTVADSYCKN